MKYEQELLNLITNPKLTIFAEAINITQQYYYSGV